MEKGPEFDLCVVVDDDDRLRYGQGQYGHGKHQRRKSFLSDIFDF